MLQVSTTWIIFCKFFSTLYS